MAVLRAVALSPETAPRSFILYGPKGCGKTSVSRIFARTLQCKGLNRKDACLVCDNCKGFSDFGANYQEIDSTQVGNVAFIRQLKEHLLYSTGIDGYRVITFDEVHTASLQSMNALLKLIEEGPRDTFYIFCSTNIDKILDTIRSRSVELSFSSVNDNELKVFLHKIAGLERVVLPESVADAIVSFSFGFVRDAIMKLDLFLQVKDEKEFLTFVRVPDIDIIDLWVCAKRGERDKFENTIKKLISFPLSLLRRSFEVFILNCIKVSVGVSEGSLTSRYKEVLSLYGQNIFQALALLSKDWVYNCFKSDVSFQAFCWYVFYSFGNKEDKIEREDSRFFNR